MSAVKKIQHVLEYAALRLMVPLVRLLPDRAAIGLGRRLGSFLRLVFRGRMRLAHENMKLAFGEALSFEQRNRILAYLMKLQGEAVIESIICTPESIAENIEVRGIENILQARAKKQGVILLGVHIDMWELAAYAFGARLDGMATVYKKLKNPYVNEYVIRARKKSGLGLIPSKNALRPVLSLLNRGLPVILLFDQNAGRSGLPATFFGARAMTYSAAAAFALKTGCAVIPCSMTKEPGFRKHRLVIEPPFPLIRTGNHEQDMLDNTQQYNDYLESIIRRNPELWFGWLHRRWRQPGSRGLKRNRKI